METEKPPKLALRNLANYIQKLYSVPLLPNIYATPILSLSVPKTPFLPPPSFSKEGRGGDTIPPLCAVLCAGSMGEKGVYGGAGFTGRKGF